MDSREFREFGKAIVNYIADYWDTIRDRDVLHSVKPGFLQSLLPEEVPQHGENWRDILEDVDKIIMPGITHWHAPGFHAYYPAGNSFPGVAGEVLSAGIGSIGYNWSTNPACTELEVAVLNWLGKLINLPDEFLNCSDGPGGGVMQGTASEATLVALLAAKQKTIRALRKANPSLTVDEIKGKLIAYTSDIANSSIEKAGMLASVPVKHLSTYDCQLKGEVLQREINKDREAGFIPCYVVATLGSTGTCAFDDLEELGKVCVKENLWLHVDAAYAGPVFICPEYQYLMKGIELCDSFNFNPHKWMLVNFDCSTTWVKDARYFIEACNLEQVALKHQYDGSSPEFRHWQIPTWHKFRALKLWFVMRMYGVEGLQDYIRTHIALAEHFEELVRQDERFEVCTSSMALVCFRFKGEDCLSQQLMDSINNDKKLYLIPCHYQDKLVIRFAVCSRITNVDDINNSWNEILIHANRIVPEDKVH